MKIRDAVRIARALTRAAGRRWPRRAHYQAVIIGRESGHRSPIDFVTFRDAGEAIAWCTMMNARRDPDPMGLIGWTNARQADRTVRGLTYYDYEPIF